MSKPGKRSKIRPEWQNLQTAAAGQGVSVTAFNRWGVSPIAKIGRQVFYLPGDITANRVANAVDKVEVPESIDREQAELEKTLLIREQRIGQELKNAQTRRELAPVTLISWTLSNVGSQISAILESIPMKIKKLLPKLSAAEVEHIRREIVKAQNAAANVNVNLDEYYDANDESDSTPSSEAPA